ncbi:hypothetical protein ACGF7U_30390 [Micromonospora sp. NPDC047670]|uniref:hypothetical protein n=1 Tax=Micromonospora sp. NPDC047670 TaxID=3364252 RepID=UPI003714A6A6
MRVSMATSAGRAGRLDEDFAGAVPGAAVLLDGAGIPGTESICRHGVAWYTHRLGGALLGRLSRDDGRDLADILATAIGEIAADHRGTCDITHPSSPQATVVIVRAHRGRLDHLLLADSFLVLDQVRGGPRVITDEREVTARRTCSAPLDGVLRGTAEYDRIRESCVEALRARRNRPGGYWIAKDDPRAAEEAVTGSLPLPDLGSVALLSNGASRIVSPVRPDRLARRVGTARHGRAGRHHPPRPAGRGPDLHRPRCSGSRRRHGRPLHWCLVAVNLRRQPVASGEGGVSNGHGWGPKRPVHAESNPCCASAKRSLAGPRSTSGSFSTKSLSTSRPAASNCRPASRTPGSVALTAREAARVPVPNRTSCSAVARATRRHAEAAWRSAGALGLAGVEAGASVEAQPDTSSRETAASLRITAGE